VEIDDWLDLPAVTRIGATTAAGLQPFHTYNENRSFPDQIKPYNFLLTTHIWAPALSLPAGYPPEAFHLIHPYEPDPRRWLELEWIDRYSGHRFRIHTIGPPSPKSIKVKTYGDVLDLYQTHPEPKSLDPGGNPCNRRSIGLLQRRPVVATEITYIGKESNRLEETTAGLIHDSTEILNSYGDANLDTWRTLVVPTLREFNTAEIAERAGLDRRTVQRLLNGTHYPRRGHRQTLTAIAADLAKASLQESGIEPPRAALAILRLHDEASTRPVPTCAICGAPLDNPRATYCGQNCKKKAYRERSRMRPAYMCDRESASHRRSRSSMPTTTTRANEPG
jgi:hypothetical protein